MLCAFDLIALDGKDLRRAPLEERKHALANVLFKERDGIIFNRHFDGDGAIIFREACALGCEGIVSKRLGSLYREAASLGHYLLRRRRAHRFRPNPLRPRALPLAPSDS